ncbi:MAG: hypothetical protein ACREQ9_12030, partial [Candidatus Binatia bacterium]
MHGFEQVRGGNRPGDTLEESSHLRLAEASKPNAGRLASEVLKQLLHRRLPPRFDVTIGADEDDARFPQPAREVLKQPQRFRVGIVEVVD